MTLDDIAKMIAADADGITVWHCDACELYVIGPVCECGAIEPRGKDDDTDQR